MRRAERTTVWSSTSKIRIVFVGDEVILTCLCWILPITFLSNKIKQLETKRLLLTVEVKRYLQQQGSIALALLVEAPRGSALTSLQAGGNVPNCSKSPNQSLVTGGKVSKAQGKSREEILLTLAERIDKFENYSSPHSQQ